MSLDLSFAEAIQEELRAIRHHLHQYPELSLKEYETQKYICQLLSQWGNCQVSEIGETGVIAHFSGEDKGPCLLFRADMDALPIAESLPDLPHKSMRLNISHKCGHDGHMTILLGLAKWLSIEGIPKGDVILLFQPAEENAHGAQKVLSDPAFTFNPDFVFALHNVPSFEEGCIVVRQESFSASVKSIAIHLTGKPAHAAQPEHGICPDQAISRLIQYATTHTNADALDPNFQLLTPIFVRLGQKAYGTLPHKGEVHFTLRSWKPEVMTRLVSQIERFLHNLAREEQLEVEWNFLEEFPAVVVDSHALTYLKDAAKATGLLLTEKSEPFRWGEDFGYFTSQFPGVMFGLGAGKSHPPLHDEKYDFPDAILLQGVQIFQAVVRQILTR